MLIDNILSPAGDHNAGDLQFGKDGNLYVSVGDGGCDYAGGGCAGGNDAARDEQVLLGKILRITPTARSRPTTRRLGPEQRALQPDRQTPLLARCRETFAWRAAQPVSHRVRSRRCGHALFHQRRRPDGWEEIDEGSAGADYGWNIREGHCATGSTTDCGPPPAGMTNPIFDYGHERRLRSITGGAFVPAAAGRGLHGHVPVRRLRLRADLPARPERRRWLHAATFVSGLSASSAVHLALRPARRGPRAVLHDVRGRRRGATRRLRPGQLPAGRRVQAGPTSGAGR